MIGSVLPIGFGNNDQTAPHLQILVNNAGVYGPLGLIEEVDWDAWVQAIEINLLLFFTGFSRSAGSILQDQKQRTEQADGAMIENLHYVKELGLRSQRALESGQAALFGELMHEHWEHKKRRSGGMSNARIDEWCELGRKHGAIGGKRAHRYRLPGRPPG